MTEGSLTSFVMEPGPDNRWKPFLDLANIPRVRLPEFIEIRRAAEERHLSIEQLLPSVEFVRDTIRFMLYQITMKGYAAIPGFRKIHLGNLEAFTDPEWKEKLPPFIRCNFTEVAKIAHEAADAFLAYCRMPDAERPLFVRRLWKYFPRERTDSLQGVTPISS